MILRTPNMYADFEFASFRGETAPANATIRKESKFVLDFALQNVGRCTDLGTLLYHTRKKWFRDGSARIPLGSADLGLSVGKLGLW